MPRSWDYHYQFAGTDTVETKTFTEPDEPVKEGFVRIYCIRGYVDHGQLWAGSIDDAGDYEWWRTNLPTEIKDVPSELLNRFEAADREWDEAHDALCKACGINPGDLY